MLPILDFSTGSCHGLAIIALTLVVRFALYPLSAGSIRNMRRTRVTQPLMQKRVKEIQERNKDNPAKLQEEMSSVYKEFGNPLVFSSAGANAGTFALFATLRGSPFSDVNYTVNLQIFPLHKLNKFNRKPLPLLPKHLYHRWGSCSPPPLFRRQPLNGGRKTKSNFKP